MWKFVVCLLSLFFFFFFVGTFFILKLRQISKAKFDYRCFSSLLSSVDFHVCRLKLFRHFDPFRVLVCSGDGSVGWVLSEIDRLNMQVRVYSYSHRSLVLKISIYSRIFSNIFQLQCEVGVLPLGTGNDLARVLGWGASCDDDAHLPQLLERYERASPKILDRYIYIYMDSTNSLFNSYEYNNFLWT